MQDNSYEPMVISTILANPKQFAIANDILSVDDFMSPVHQDIWRAMESAHEDGVVPAPRVLETRVTQAGAAVAIQVLELQSKQVEVLPLARQMIEANRKARLLQAIEVAKASEDVATDLEKAIDAFRSKVESTSVDMKGMLRHTINYLAAVNEGATGVLTGIQAIDDRVNGFRPGQLIIIAARPGIGKTALALQATVFAAEHGNPGGVCELEMDEGELGMRIMSHRLKIKLGDLVRAEPDALAEIGPKMQQTGLKELPIEVNCSQYRLDQICNQIRVWVKHNSIKFAVVDHIGLVEVPGATNPNERVGTVTRTLKKLAKDLQIPIIAVSQLNRGNTKENRRPALSDLRDSGSVEQDANICIFVHDDDFCYRLGILKNRNGPKGWVSDAHGNELAVNFNGQYQTYSHEPQEMTF
jgi:replicative DNA helicase